MWVLDGRTPGWVVATAPWAMTSDQGAFVVTLAGRIGRSPRSTESLSHRIGQAAVALASQPVGRLAALLCPERLSGRTRWASVLFHHVTDGLAHRADDPLVAGLDIDMAVEAFTSVIENISRRYRMVSLDDALAAPRRRLGARPNALVCFDDAYASVASIAAPVLRRMGVPWVFFVNPGLVDGRTICLDNLLAYVANTRGLAVLADVSGLRVESVPEFIRTTVARMGPAERSDLSSHLCTAADVDPGELARSSGLYVSSDQLRELAAEGVEIGNHTWDHVHCGALGGDDIAHQVAESARELERIVDRRVRAFAFPYGSRRDATAPVLAALAASGHECAFLVHGRTNDARTPRMLLHRISVHETTVAGTAFELSVLPGAREIVQRVRGVR